MSRRRGFPAIPSSPNATSADDIYMSKPNKYVIRTSIVEGDKRVRYYFATREAARRWCAQYLVPRSMIKKL